MKKRSQNAYEIFQQGLLSATDQENQLSVQTGGKATTSLQSFWLHQHCIECSHTFRLGDEVEIYDNGTVKHASPKLPCAQKEVNPKKTSDELTAFYAGLDEAWPPPKDKPVKRLEEGDPLLAEPFGGFKRRTCAVCGHTLRLHDHVIICPCDPKNPKCEKAVHRDPLHGLHCFENWNPGANSQHHCPVTAKEING